MLSEEGLLQLLPCQHLIALQIFIDRLLNDIIRQCPVVVRICLQPVAGELLVKGRLSVSRLVSVCRPEAGAVRCEHLVAENDVSVFIEAELELCICDDDAAAQRVVRTFLVQGDGVVAELGSVFLAFAREIFLQVGNALLVGNVLVMIADLSLCGRSVDRFRELVGFSSAPPGA